NSACLQVVVDVLEDGADLRAKQNQRANDHDGHQRDDQGVLDEALAAVAAEQPIQHLPFSSHLTDDETTPRRRGAPRHTTAQSPGRRHATQRNGSTSTRRHALCRAHSKRSSTSCQSLYTVWYHRMLEWRPHSTLWIAFSRRQGTATHPGAFRGRCS